MKYRELFIKYNLYLKILYFHCSENIKNIYIFTSENIRFGSENIRFVNNIFILFRFHRFSSIYKELKLIFVTIDVMNIYKSQSLK